MSAKLYHAGTEAGVYIPASYMGANTRDIMVSIPASVVTCARAEDQVSLYAQANNEYAIRLKYVPNKGHFGPQHRVSSSPYHRPIAHTCNCVLPAAAFVPFTEQEKIVKKDELSGSKSGDLARVNQGSCMALQTTKPHLKFTCIQTIVSQVKAILL